MRVTASGRDRILARTVMHSYRKFKSTDFTCRSQSNVDPSTAAPESIHTLQPHLKFSTALNNNTSHEVAYHFKKDNPSICDVLKRSFTRK